MNKLEKNNNINNLYNKIVYLIEDAKRNVVTNVNREITLLYWNIGKDITENILKNERAEYGKFVINELSKRLILNYGTGYSKSNISRMLKFYNCFPDFGIVATLSQQLSWSHFIEILKIENSIKREFILLCA